MITGVSNVDLVVAWAFLPEKQNDGQECPFLIVNPNSFTKSTRRGCDFLHAVFVVPPLGGIEAG